MPTARKLPSGSWRCQVFSHYEILDDGRKKRIYRSFTSDDPSKTGKKIAEQAAADFALSRKDNRRSNMLFSEALEQYIKGRTEILSPATIRKYNSMSRTLEDYMKDVTLDDLNDASVQAIMNRMAPEYSAKTLRDLYGLIATVLKKHRPDVRLDVALPKKQRVSRYIPTDADVTALIAAAAGTDMELPVYLAAFGGLRRGEISALRVSDISGNMVHVHATMVLNDDGEWIEKAPKSFAGDRYVALPEFIIKLLKKREDRVTDLRPNMITSSFEHLLNRAGLSHFRFHDLRHYNASIQHALGIPDAFIMQSGGWSNDRVLKEVYRHAMTDRQAQIENVAISHFEELCNTKCNTK